MELGVPVIHYSRKMHWKLSAVMTSSFLDERRTKYGCAFLTLPFEEFVMLPLKYSLLFTHKIRKIALEASSENHV